MDIAMVVLAAFAVIVSIIAICVSYNAAQKGNLLANSANDIARMANQMQKAQIEMQMRELISAARSRYEDRAAQLAGNPDSEVHKALVDSAHEDFLNAYDEICSKYLDDGKVDKVRFKKLYHDEIRQLVIDPSNIEKYREPQTKFHATNKVYNEWNNLER